MDSLQALKVNLVSSTWKVSLKIGILQSGIVHYFHNLGKII